MNPKIGFPPDRRSVSVLIENSDFFFLSKYHFAFSGASRVETSVLLAFKIGLLCNCSILSFNFGSSSIQRYMVDL